MFFETFFGLAKDGKTNSKGLPNLLSMAVIMREATTPRCSWRARRPSSNGLSSLALVGRRSAYRGWDPRTRPSPIPRPE